MKHSHERALKVGSGMATSARFLINGLYSQECLLHHQLLLHTGFYPDGDFISLQCYYLQGSLPSVCVCDMGPTLTSAVRSCLIKLSTVTCIHTCIHTYIYAHTLTFIQIIHTYIRLGTHVHIFMHTHFPAHTYIRKRMYI